jgi:tetratricopeptide (TPR) repeat protein
MKLNKCLPRPRRRGCFPVLLSACVLCLPVFFCCPVFAGGEESGNRPSRDSFRLLLSQAQESAAGRLPDQSTVDAFPGAEVQRLNAEGLGRFSQGDFVGAIIEYTNAIKIDPKRGSLYLQRGLSNLELDNYQTALDDLDRAYELDHSNKLAILVCRARALEGLGKYDLSLADLDKAIQEDPKFILAYISRADTYLSRGDDGKALADLEEALRLDPRQPRAYFLRARYYKRQNKNDLALKDFSTAVFLDASFLDRDYSRSGADRDLRDHFNKALKLGRSKETSPALVERGIAHERNGEYLEAIKELTDAITDAPDSLEAYRWRATVYMHMSSFDRAIEDLNQAIKLSPQDPSLHALAAKAYLDLGQSEKALASYNRAVELSGDPPASLFEARGLVHSRTGQSSLAIADFTKSIEIDPAGSTAYADRGLEYLVQKRYKEAVLDFSDSIKNGQELAVSYKFRGQCKYFLGDPKGAVADLEKAAQLCRSQNDFYGRRQVEKMIDEIRKGDKLQAG